MLSLKLIRLTSLYLKIDKCGQIGYFLLDGIQSHHTIQLLQTLLIVHRLRSLVWYILRQDGHKLLVGQILRSIALQTLCLFLTDLVKKSAYRSTICEVLVTRVVHLLDHLAKDSFSLRRYNIFLLIGKSAQYLVQFLWLIVFYIQEVIETATEAWVHPEQVVHFHEITSSDDDKFSSVILHSLHKLL